MPRVVFSVAALIAIGSAAAAASDDFVSQPGTSRCAAAAPCAPTKFDYLVLASMADSPHFLTFGGYRPMAQERAAGPSLKNTNSPDDKGK